MVQKWIFKERTCTLKNLDCKTSDLTTELNTRGKGFRYIQAQEIHTRESARRKIRKRESNKSPLDWGRGSWLDRPERLIKMEFLMLIFVFSQKGWHILERHTACIFNDKSPHIFSCTPHCLVPRVTTARCTADSHRIVAHYLSLSALTPGPPNTCHPHSWIIVSQVKTRGKLRIEKIWRNKKLTGEQRGRAAQEQLRSCTSKWILHINNVLSPIHLCFCVLATLKVCT